MVASWAVLALLGARLPDGAAKELASFLPDCVVTVRRLRRHPDVPRSAKVAVSGAALWLASPIDLVPDFIPVIGLLDDVIVVALALRYAARRVPPSVLEAAWPGSPDVLGRVLGTRRRPSA